MRGRERPRELLLGVAALGASQLVWGVGFPLTKVVLADFSALELAFVRTGFAAAALFALAWRDRARLPSWRLTLALCLTGTIGYYVLMNAGLARVGVGTSALILALTPVLTAPLAMALLGERPGPPALAGIALAVGGGAVIATGGMSASPFGTLVLFGSALSWSLYIVLLRGWASELPASTVTVAPLLLALVLLAPSAAGERWDAHGVAPWLLAAGLGVVSQGLGGMLWNYGASRTPATQAGICANLAPVVSVLVAWLALREPLAARELVGGALVIGGALLSLAPAIAGGEAAASGAPPAGAEEEVACKSA